MIRIKNGFAGTIFCFVGSTNLSILNTRILSDVFLPGVSLLQVLPGLCGGQPDTLNFDGDLQQLYTAVVVAQGNAQTRKRKLSEREDEQQGEESLAAAVASTPGLFEFRCLNF